MRKNISWMSLLFWMLITEPVFSFFLESTGIHYYYVTEPIIGLLVLFVLMKSKRAFTQATICVGLTVICVLLAVSDGANLGKINNHFFNYIDTVLLLILVAQYPTIQHFREMFESHIIFLKLWVLFLNIAEGFLLVTRKGYTYKFNWGGNFFHGTNSMPHTLAYLMLITLVQASLIIIFTKNKRYILLTFIPIFAIFASGARIALVLAVAPILILSNLFFTRNQKSIFVKILAVLVLVVAVFFAFKNKLMNSDLMLKIQKRETSGNVSAGRTYIWENLLGHYFKDSTLVQYVFGQGDDKSYFYNSLNPLVGGAVWAHNDFVQILLGKGLVGFCIYVISLVRSWLTIRIYNRSFYSLLVVLFVLVAALMNGFYSYLDMMASVPFIALLAAYADGRTS